MSTSMRCRLCSLAPRMRIALPGKLMGDVTAMLVLLPPAESGIVRRLYGRGKTRPRGPLHNAASKRGYIERDDVTPVVDSRGGGDVSHASGGGGDRNRKTRRW